MTELSKLEQEIHDVIFECFKNGTPSSIDYAKAVSVVCRKKIELALDDTKDWEGYRGFKSFEEYKKKWMENNL